jgi:glutamine amidotransferase
MSKMIVIIDYNLGNVNSIANMIKKIGYKCIITSNPHEISQADKIILPGVGAFDYGIQNLKKLNIYNIIIKKVIEEKTPILGICLGMQLLTDGSEEGIEKGFGFVKGYAKKFQFSDNNLKVPHMGWNTVKITKKSKLFYVMENQENRFYFVHSYAVECFDEEDILTLTSYGYDFVSAFEKNNIIGVQFHPEKSHKFGMQLLKNFIEKY